MKIVSSQKIEDCFDGSVIYEYIFDVVWDYKKLLVFKHFGELEYYKDFPRPFFRILNSSGLNIKGVGGGNSCRVIFPKKDRIILKDSFESFFNKD